MDVNELRERAQPWTAPISDAQPAGTNASADPQYADLREEVAKRDSPTGGQIQWRKVIDNATEVLQNRSKDLLVASYMAFGLYTSRGLDGLVTGVAVVSVIIEDYWPNAFPEQKRMRGRVNALEWLVKSCENVLPNIPVTAQDRKVLNDLDFAAKHLSRVAREKFADNCPAMRPLTEGVQRLMMNLPAEAPAEPVAPPPQSATPEQSVAPAPVAAPVAAPPPPPPPAPVAVATPVAVVAMPSVAASAPADASQVVDFLAGLGASMFDAAGTLRNADATNPLSYRMARLGMYMHLTQPPSANAGKTSIPAPREAFRTQLATIANNRVWAALLEESESALRGARFWLDLHRYSAMALAGLGDAHKSALAELLRETAQVLRRMPELADLAFNDGTPFASGDTKSWIASEVLAGGGAGPSTGAGAPQVVVVQSAGGGGAGGGEDAAVIDEARALAKQGKLADAMALLHGRLMASATASARFRVRVGIGQVCLAASQPAMARAVFEATEADVQRHGLEEWDPALAATSSEGLYTALRRLAQAGKPMPPEAVLLYDRVCRLDPAAALRLGV